ncbi:hypothetical protein TWF730_008708 [Orbilia blumenaviensis]|uniref:G domain-containing protein n=1 Tax=Orbilia blumenaviensis TaxID=1796055 RepID=A0AAV9V6C3_9PEZI
MKEIDILLIGPSQSGKSEFINKIRKLHALKYGVEGDVPEVGNGSFSCTQVCKTYDILFERTRYKLLHKETQEEIVFPQGEGEAFFKRFWRKRTIDNTSIHPIKENPDAVRLRIIDTPGLDDSNASDPENMVKVLRYLHSAAQARKTTHLTAVIFIIKSSSAFDQTLQGVYRYYKTCMPNLFGGLVVVNTNYTVQSWKTIITRINKEKKISGYPDTLPATYRYMQQRREEFCNIFEQDARHFFIDSVPSSSYISEELITRNQIYNLVEYLTCLKKMPVENIRLPKTPSIKAADESFIKWLISAKSILNEEERRELLKLTLASEKFHWLRACSFFGLADIDCDIKKMESQVKILNNTDKIILRTYSTDPEYRLQAPSGLSSFVKRLSTQHKMVIREPDNPGFIVEVQDSQYCQWHDKRHNPAMTEWSGWYTAPIGLPLSFNMIVSIESRKYYRKMIEDIRKDIFRKKIEREKLRLRLRDLDKESIEILQPSFLQPVQAISELIHQCKVLIKELASPFDLILSETNETTLNRYSRTKSDPASIDDLVEFVRDSGYTKLEKRFQELLTSGTWDP